MFRVGVTFSSLQRCVSCPPALGLKPMRFLLFVASFPNNCGLSLSPFFLSDYQALLDLDENNEAPSRVGASEGEIRRNPSFLIRCETTNNCNSQCSRDSLVRKCATLVSPDAQRFRAWDRMVQVVPCRLEYSTVGTFALLLSSNVSLSFAVAPLPPCPGREPAPDNVAKPRNCTICLYPFKPRERVRIIPCLHQFHTEVRSIPLHMGMRMVRHVDVCILVVFC